MSNATARYNSKPFLCRGERVRRIATDGLTSMSALGFCPKQERRAKGLRSSRRAGREPAPLLRGAGIAGAQKLNLRGSSNPSSDAQRRTHVHLLTLIRNLVGARGFEPPTPCTPCRCATRLRYAPTVSGWKPGLAPGKARNHTRSRRPAEPGWGYRRLRPVVCGGRADRMSALCFYPERDG